MDSTTWLNHMKRWLKSVLFSLPIVSPVFCVALAHFFHTAPHLFAMEGSSHKWTFVFAKHQLRVSANIYKPTSNRETGVGSPHVSASNTGDRMMTDVSESGLSLLQYLPMSYGDQCHMKEAQLGFKLKGRAQDLKGGACPCGRWPVAPFSCTSQTSLNPYTCTLGMFHPGAQLVWWTQSQEHVMGDKFSDAGLVPDLLTLSKEVSLVLRHSTCCEISYTPP